MFSINLIQPREGPGNCKTLHSTMFSINQKNNRSGKRSSSALYIPLCFLLIKKSVKNCTTTFFSLHSTMFSINLPSVTYMFVLLLSLHSTMFSINRHFFLLQTSLCLLYIPLCFLLINKGNRGGHVNAILYIPLCFLLIPSFLPVR